MRQARGSPAAAANAICEWSDLSGQAASSGRQLLRGAGTAANARRCLSVSLRSMWPRADGLQLASLSELACAAAGCWGGMARRHVCGGGSPARSPARQPRHAIMLKATTARSLRVPGSASSCDSLSVRPASALLLLESRLLPPSATSVVAAAIRSPSVLLSGAWPRHWSLWAS